MNPRIVSIIIPCKNEGIYIKQTVDFLLETEARHIADIIIVDDLSNDSCCSFLEVNKSYHNNITLIKTSGIGASRSRNLGASVAASSKFLVFCDAHIIMKKNWLYTLIHSFNNPLISAVCPGIRSFNPNSAVGYGQSFNENFQIYWLKKPDTLSEIPIAPGGCIAIRKDVFNALGGFDNGFFSWGYEDVELSLRLWLCGYKVYVEPNVIIGHKFRKTQPYNVDLIEFNYNKLRMCLLHFNHNRICKILKPMYVHPNFEKIIYRLMKSDTLVSRESYFSKRTYDDDWFFNKFNIPF